MSTIISSDLHPHVFGETFKQTKKETLQFVSEWKNIETEWWDYKSFCGSPFLNICKVQTNLQNANFKLLDVSDSVLDFEFILGQFVSIYRCLLSSSWTMIVQRSHIVALWDLEEPLVGWCDCEWAIHLGSPLKGINMEERDCKPSVLYTVSSR